MSPSYKTASPAVCPNPDCGATVAARNEGTTIQVTTKQVAGQLLVRMFDNDEGTLHACP